MTEPLFPEPLADDDDDVAWALQTAKVQWNRGGFADAIVWLRRAADSADQLGLVWRAADLRRIAEQLDASSHAAPAEHLPQWAGEHDLEDAEESGVTAIPPPTAAKSSFVSYSSVHDIELEEEPAPSVEIIAEPDSANNPQLAQLLGTEIELTDEVEMIEDPDEFEADVIDDDALSAPPLSAVPNTDRAPELDDAELDDPVTQPVLDDPALLDIPRRSPLPPPRPSFAAHARARARAPAPPEPEEDPRLGDVLLGEVRGLEDVPPEGQAILAHEARIERLHAEEEVSSFGLALVLKGSVHVMPAVADLSCARALKGEIVWSQGNLDDGVALRLVAAEDDSEVAVWSAELLKSTVRDYPWVVADLKALADRFQALAGIAMGPMGERLDDALRAMIAERCEIKRLLPGEVLATQGKSLGGMYVVAAGRVEVLQGDAIEEELGPGEFLFGTQVLSNGPAPNDARAGRGGALVMFATRAVAHELLLSVPPLLEIFAL